MQLTPQRKWLYIIGGSVLVVIIIIGTLLSNAKKPNSTTATVNVAVIPSDSTLYIDGKQTKPGSITLTKTTHTFKATRQYFGDAVRDINIANVDPSQTIYMLPDPNTPQAQQYFKDHPDEQAARVQHGPADISQIQDQLHDKYPILANLPYQTTDFMIDYEIDANKNPIFHVTLYVPYDTGDNHDQVVADTAAFKNEALQYLKDSGVDVTKANITYQNY